MCAADDSGSDTNVHGEAACGVQTTALARCLSVGLSVREAPNIQKFNKVCKLHGITCVGCATVYAFLANVLQFGLVTC